MTRLSMHTESSSTSLAARAVNVLVRNTLRPALALGCSHGPDLADLPRPLQGAIAAASRLIPAIGAPPVGTATVRLTHTTMTITSPARPAGSGGDFWSRGAILYLHGGAFFTCDHRSHAAIINRLAHYSGAVVASVDYRRHPRHDINDALDDALEAYQRLMEMGFSSDQIAVAGDSSGGFLALAAARALWLDEYIPAALALLSPLVWLTDDGRRHPHAHLDAMLAPVTFAYLERMVRRAAGDDRVFDLHLDNLPHGGMPPTMIHVSGSEALFSDAHAVARKLATAGTHVRLHVWPGQIHVFQIAAGLVPEADRSLWQIATFVRNQIDAANGRRRRRHYQEAN